MTEDERVARLLADGEPARSPDRAWWIWAVYIVLYGLSIPWYWSPGPARVWLGLPHWVVVSIVSLVCVAIFTCWVARRWWVADEPVPLDEADHGREAR
ncbi:MAG: hypothetical protein AB1635_10350 [Acidobacteriota bacterium]